VDFGGFLGRLAFAVGIPAVAGGLVVAGRRLAADGPDFFAATARGGSLCTVLVVGGFALAASSQLRYRNVLVFFGAFFVFMTGLQFIGAATDAEVLARRGEPTSCTVLAVHPVTVSSGENHRVRHVTDVECTDRAIRSMTTDDRLGVEGERIDVVHDPRGRVDPRLADDVTHSSTTWRQGWLLVAAGAGLRLLYEFDVPFFGCMDE
jgi:hypothetical protein